MPIYTYKDENGHITEIIHAMTQDEPYFCPICGAEMWRVPQPVSAIWHGDKPSAGGWHPLVKQLKADKGKNQEKFYRKREEHYRRTAHELQDSGS